MGISSIHLRQAFVGYPPGSRAAKEQVTEVLDAPVPPEILQRIQAGRKAAAVLIPIMGQGGHAPLRVLLTRRTEQLRDHAGQISFPGGGLKLGESAIAAALRETEEEIGLSPAQVELFGELPRYLTGTGFSVSPLIGFVDGAANFKADVGEVDEIFEVPLDFLMDSRNFRKDTRFYRGAWRSFWVVPWSGYDIWGATAGMLVELARILGEPRKLL